MYSNSAREANENKSIKVGYSEAEEIWSSSRTLTNHSIIACRTRKRRTDGMLLAELGNGASSCNNNGKWQGKGWGAVTRKPNNPHKTMLPNPNHFLRRSQMPPRNAGGIPTHQERRKKPHWLLDCCNRRLITRYMESASFRFLFPSRYWRANSAFSPRHELNAWSNHDPKTNRNLWKEEYELADEAARWWWETEGPRKKCKRAIFAGRKGAEHHQKRLQRERERKGEVSEGKANAYHEQGESEGRRRCCSRRDRRRQLQSRRDPAAPRLAATAPSPSLPRPPRSEMRWAGGASSRPAPSSNGCEPRRGSERGAGGGDGDLIVGLFTRSLELLIRKAGTAGCAALSSIPGGNKRKGDLFSGEVLGWTRLARRTSALVLSVRGGWGRRRRAARWFPAPLPHSLVMRVVCIPDAVGPGLPALF